MINKISLFGPWRCVLNIILYQQKQWFPLSCHVHSCPPCAFLPDPSLPNSLVLWVIVFSYFTVFANQHSPPLPRAQDSEKNFDKCNTALNLGFIIENVLIIMTLCMRYLAYLFSAFLDEFVTCVYVWPESQTPENNNWNHHIAHSWGSSS